MKSYYLTISLLLFSLLSHSQLKDQIRIVKLLCNNTENRAVIPAPDPQFSWQLTSKARNQHQLAYQILVSDNRKEIENSRGNIWDSGKVNSNQSIFIPYKGQPLNPAHTYFWKVKVWNQKGIASEWSKAGTFQTGLFADADWKNAQWIGYDDMPAELKLFPGIHGNGDNQGPKALKRTVVPLFRKSFTVHKKVSSATLFISGLGHYEAFVNGGKVSESFLAPGWTNYDKAVFYNAYDVTSRIRKGENILGAIVGNGFYNINRERYRKLVIAYGMPKLFCRLQIEYTDGTKEDVVSDGSWKTAASPITYASIYGGEDYDARLEQPNWDKPGFDASAWQTVKLVTPPAGKLTAETDYPLRVMENFAAKEISEVKPKVFLYDFAQNASGIIELKVKGKKGQEVRLIPAELITKDKLANQQATGGPYYFSYILKGDGEEIWRPRFTYYGFRYVQVEGASPEKAGSSSDGPVIIHLKMLHTRNSAPGTGSFECSNKLFNSIFSLIDWSVKSNLQSVLTDCPHREKLGWMEQTYLMGNSVQFNYNIYHLYEKLVNDMIQDQTPEGMVPDIAPEYVQFEGGFRDSPEWGSAAVILPWLLYEKYGDAAVLEKAWPMMVRYVTYLKSKSVDNIVSHGLGDWFDMGPRQPGESQLTPKSLTATAIYYYDLNLLTKIAGILGKDSDQRSLAAWADSVKTSFNTKFFNKQTGVIATGSQTSMAMPWSVGLVDPEYRDLVINNLEDSIRANGKALTAGDIGFHYLVEALTKGGKSQLLYEMNNRNDVPGYGFQLAKGATALTESWPALENVSNNHLMLGHLMEWFYAGLAGIGQSETSVAYKEITIKPEMPDGLTHASASYDSSYGLIKSHWTRNGKTVSCTVEVPVNTTALVSLAVTPESVITESGRPVSQVKDVEVISKKDGLMVCRVGSGNYSFSIEN